MLQLPGNVLTQDLEKAKGYNGAMLHSTKPNSRVAVFDETDDVFYIIKTDINNNKIEMDRYRFYPEPIEDVNDRKYASKEDFNTLKEMIENVQQSVWELTRSTADNKSNAANRQNKQNNGTNKTGNTSN